MSDVTVSFRVDEKLHALMRLHEEINWSAVIRKTVSEKLERLETIDKERAINAAKIIDKLRKRKVFDNGGSVTQTIREWRDKRK